jgi:hypothetical protein
LNYYKIKQITYAKVGICIANSGTFEKFSCTDGVSEQSACAADATCGSKKKS